MAQLNTSALGTSLQQMLMCDEIEPGSEPSYQLCKVIYLYHPLGAKLVERPLEIAQSQKRKITIPNSPETRVKEAFETEWVKLKADEHIFNTMRLARIYGIAAMALLVDGVASDLPMDYKKLAGQKISFNSFDPLNTAGSLVLNQNPNALDFQHVTDIRVQGKTYHRSRSCVVLNESPIYIGYTNSAFGYVGRSVYQRALYPLKSFIQSMITDDLVTVKAGVLIAKMEQPGSIIDRAMQVMFGVKRALLKEAATGNVLGIGLKDSIETLNMQNLDGAFGMARKDILENIAAAAGMPAQLVTQETFAEGFGEGTEDAKNVVRFINRTREQMEPLYEFFTTICQYRAWNPQFYETIQQDFPTYKDVTHTQAFYDWGNSFTSAWPSLIEEPESELIKVDDVKLKAIIALVEVLLPDLDPENRAALIQWAQDNFNALKRLFDQPLDLDYDALREYEPPQALEEPHEPKPFASTDSAMVQYNEAVLRLGSRARGKDRRHSLLGLSAAK